MHNVYAQFMNICVFICKNSVKNILNFFKLIIYIHVITFFVNKKIPLKWNFLFIARYTQTLTIQVEQNVLAPPPPWQISVKYCATQSYATLLCLLSCLKFNKFFVYHTQELSIVECVM